MAVKLALVLAVVLATQASGWYYHSGTHWYSRHMLHMPAVPHAKIRRGV
jgi:hypothetical protein